MDHSTPKTALVLIDFQKGFDAPFWGQRNNHDAEKNALALLDHFRSASEPIFHVRHLSREEGSPLRDDGGECKSGFSPLEGESVIEKTVNSAFIGTDLEARLRDEDIHSLVICGLTTPHCVSTTTRMAANLGFQVTLAGDACAAFARNADVSFDDGPPLSPEECHRSALAHLHGEFATVMATAKICDGSRDAPGQADH